MTPNGAVEPVQDAVHALGFPRLRADMRMGSDCRLRNPQVLQDDSRAPCRKPTRPVHRIGARSTDRWDRSAVRSTDNRAPADGRIIQRGGRHPLTHESAPRSGPDTPVRNRSPQPGDPGQIVRDPAALRLPLGTH